jgi:hypothetical protein
MIKSRGWEGRGMRHEVGKRYTHIRFCCSQLKETACFEVIGLDVKVILKWILKKYS